MSAASVKQIHEWFQEAQNQGATHLVVVCDTYDWDDYPIYVMPDQDLRLICAEHDEENMQRIMEVYDISKGEEQIKVGVRVYNGYQPGTDKPQVGYLLRRIKQLEEQLDELRRSAGKVAGAAEGLFEAVIEEISRKDDARCRRQSKRSSGTKTATGRGKKSGRTPRTATRKRSRNVLSQTSTKRSAPMKSRAVSSKC